MITTRALRAATIAGLTALALTGCANTPLSPATSTSTSTEPDGPTATPTDLEYPMQRTNWDHPCTVDATGDHPTRAQIDCGDYITITLEGDFREGVTNEYNPADAGGVRTVLVMGDETRVWMERGNSACLISYSEGDDDAVCEMATRQGPSPQGA